MERFSTHLYLITYVFAMFLDVFRDQEHHGKVQHAFIPNYICFLRCFLRSFAGRSSMEDLVCIYT